MLVNDSNDWNKLNDINVSGNVKHNKSSVKGKKKSLVAPLKKQTKVKY